MHRVSSYLVLKKQMHDPLETLVTPGYFSFIFLILNPKFYTKYKAI